MADFWTKIRKISQNTLETDHFPPVQGLKDLKILVSPLDWGLGHATRIIPLVHGLRDLGARVWLAADGPVASLLSAEFPDLPLLELAGYRVRYPKLGRLFIPSMFGQLPSLLNAIKREKVWLRRMQPEIGWNVVISDNRYGLHHPDTRNILLTHQVYPQSGVSLLPGHLLHHIHRRFMRAFDETWIPDAAGHVNLSGALSHPPPAGIRHAYIGPLSRFSRGKTTDAPPLAPGSYYLAVISGPEPQRSLFEQKILSSMQGLDLPLVLVRGLPGAEGMETLPGNIIAYQHAGANLMASLVLGAAAVVCRAGYSTIMDLVCLGKRALLVPTPGQTEQLYLARYLSGKGYFPTLDQEDFRMDEAMEILRRHRGDLPAPDFNQHRDLMQGQLLQPIVAQHSFNRNPD